MATPLSPARASVPIIQSLELLHRGKVRDTYRLADELLLVVTTDGVSIFDFVLNALVPWKGIVLNALSYYWLTRIEAELGISTHLVAAGRELRELDRYLPLDLRDDLDLLRRSTVVRRLDMLPVESVARSYRVGNTVAHARTAGYVLPGNLREGDRLPFTLATPTTKAAEGHDEPLLLADAASEWGEAIIRTVQIQEWMHELLLPRGLIQQDCKLEWAVADRKLILGDEPPTFDSARYVDRLVWEASRQPGGSLSVPSLSKQLVREWGITVGLDKLDPKNPADITAAHAIEVPTKVIDEVTAVARYLFWRITGEQIEPYLTYKLGVETLRPMRKVAVILGSESDLSVRDDSVSVKERLAIFSKIRGVRPIVHVMSCHRNLDTLSEFAMSGADGADVVICAGSKALALPGILDVMLHEYGHPLPVLGVALGQPGTPAFEAARLSIKELPGSPVVMDEISGEPYHGVLGLEKALLRAYEGEFLPQKHAVRPPILNVHERWTDSARNDDDTGAS